MHLPALGFGVSLPRSLPGTALLLELGVSLPTAARQNVTTSSSGPESTKVVPRNPPQSQNDASRTKVVPRNPPQFRYPTTRPCCFLSGATANGPGDSVSSPVATVAVACSKNSRKLAPVALFRYLVTRPESTRRRKAAERSLVEAHDDGTIPY